MAQIYRGKRLYILDPVITRIENLLIYSFLEHIIPNFWAQQRRTYQDSTNLQRKATICSGPSEQKNGKSTNLQLFGAYNTKLLGSAKKTSQESTNLLKKATI